MNLRLAFLFCLFSCSDVSPQSDIPPLPGWDKQLSKGITRFTPKSTSQTGVSYEIMPLQKISKEEESNISGWLKATAMKNLSSLGYNASSIGNSESVDENGYYYYTMEVRPPAGKTLVVSFISFRQVEGQMRLAKYTQPADLTTSFADAALNHFMGLSKTAGKMKKSDQSTTPPTATQGLKPAHIEGVVIHAEYGYGVGGISILEYKPYLLLKDGSIYKYPKSSPYDLNVKASRESEPNMWGTWKLQGKTLLVQLPEKAGMKSYEWNEQYWHWTKPAAKSDFINGSFLAMSGGGNTATGGSTMIATSSNIRFNNKGQFSHSTSTGITSGETGAYAESDKAGTYKVDGYSIELRYNNGQTARLLFYFFPDGKDNFGLGGRTYTKD